MGRDSPRAAFILRLKNALVQQGLQEVITHSLVADGGPGALLLRNPMAPEYSQLRTSLVPNHIGIAQRAVREGIRDIAIFEVASVYKPGSEPLRVSGLVSGSANANLWAIKGESYPADFYFAKGIVESLLAGLGIVAGVRRGHVALHASVPNGERFGEWSEYWNDRGSSRRR